MAKSKFVASVLKSLDLLQAINERDGMTAFEVAKLVGVPRPTAYRLLETLEEAGLIIRGPSDDGWHLTVKVKRLSSGFRDELGIAQCAVPAMRSLGRQILWPLDLSTFENYSMVVRESTHATSPFSLDLGMVGRGVPLLLTAAGRAYLAFCPPSERKAILAALARFPGDEFSLAREPQALNQILSRVQETGLGFRHNLFKPHTQSISAPIIVGDRVLACLTIIWISSAISFEEANEKFRGPLLETTKQIVATFEEKYISPGNSRSGYIADISSSA